MQSGALSDPLHPPPNDDAVTSKHELVLILPKGCELQHVDVVFPNSVVKESNRRGEREDLQPGAAVQKRLRDKGPLEQHHWNSQN